MDKFQKAQKDALELGAKYQELVAGKEVDGFTLETCNDLLREAKSKYRLEIILDLAFRFHIQTEKKS